MESKLVNFDELPFELTPEENEQFFQILPKEIQVLAETNMEMFNEKAMEYVVVEKLQYNSIEDYYDSIVSYNYINNDTVIPIAVLFEDFNKYNIEFDIIFINKKGDDVVNSGSMKIVAYTLENAWKNSFFSVSQQLLKTGEVLKSLTISNVTLV